MSLTRLALTRLAYFGKSTATGCQSFNFDDLLIAQLRYPY